MFPKHGGLGGTLPQKSDVQVDEDGGVIALLAAGGIGITCFKDVRRSVVRIVVEVVDHRAERIGKLFGVSQKGKDLSGGLDAA